MIRAPEGSFVHVGRLWRVALVSVQDARHARKVALRVRPNHHKFSKTAVAGRPLHHEGRVRIDLNARVGELGACAAGAHCRRAVARAASDGAKPVVSRTRGGHQREHKADIAAATTAARFAASCSEDDEANGEHAEATEQSAAVGDDARRKAASAFRRRLCVVRDGRRPPSRIRAE